MLQAVLVNSKIFFSLLLLSLLLFLTDQLGLLNPPKSVLQVITIPIQYGLYQTSLNVSKQFEFIILARKASQENKALTEQIAYILSENAALRRRLAETEGFLEQQKSLSPQTFNLIPARPIGANRFLVIDKGSEDGLKVGLPVVYKDNLLGEVKEISPRKANVALVSDPDSRIVAFVSSSNGRAKGVLAGQFGSEMILDKILHQEPVVKGDLVYSEGSDMKIPRGLILGQVTEVLQRDNEVFKQAKVKPIFNITNLEVVFIITE